MQPGQPPQPQGQPPQQGSPVEAIVSQVSQGLAKLMEVFQQAQLPPQDIQHLGGIITSFQALIEELSGGQKPQPQQPQGARPENAGPGSRPLPQG